MSAYTSTDQLHQIMHELWTAIGVDPSMSNKLVQSRLITRFHYQEPTGCVTIDASDGKQVKVIVGESKLVPTVEMSMKSDVAHEFWLGKVSIPVAIISGKIAAKGPVNSALALLPVIKPAFEFYLPIYEKHTVQPTASK